MKTERDAELADAYDAGFGAGIRAGTDLVFSAKRNLNWCWFLLVIETVLLAAFVARLGVIWFFGA